MKSINTVLLLFLIALACSGGSGDPVAPGGGSGPGASRANLAVEESNRYMATQVFFDDIRAHFNKALGIVTHSDTSEAVRIMGNHNGYSLVRALTGTDTTAVPDINVKYVNYYSETGKLFYDGELTLRGEWNYIGNTRQLKKFVLNGATDISGDYACQITFENFHMALNPDGMALNMQWAIDSVVKYGRTYSRVNDGVVVITSNSQTYRFSPYLFDYAPI